MSILLKNFGSPWSCILSPTPSNVSFFFPSHSIDFKVRWEIWKWRARWFSWLAQVFITLWCGDVVTHSIHGWKFIFLENVSWHMNSWVSIFKLLNLIFLTLRRILEKLDDKKITWKLLLGTSIISHWKTRLQNSTWLYMTSKLKI